MSLKAFTTEYGADLNCTNKEVLRAENDGFEYIMSMFKHDDLFYAVHIWFNGSGDTGLGWSPIHSQNYDDYSDNRTYAGTGLRVFNKFIYVLMMMLRKYPLNQIAFEGKCDTLKHLYDNAVKNCYLKIMIESEGYRYAGKDSDEYHVFEAI